MSATDNIKNLQMLLDTLSADHLGKEEFTKSFKAVVDFVKKIDSRNADEFKQIRQILSDLAQKVQEENTSLTNDLKGQVDHVFVGKKLDEMSSKNEMSISEMKGIMKTMMDEMMAKMHAKMMSMKDGAAGMRGERGVAGAMGPMPSKTELMNLIEPIIKDIKQELRTALAGKRRMGMRKVPVVKRIVLTSQTNGSTRSFSLPKDTVQVLGVWGTDFPMTFDDADFTLTGNTLTLASTFNAPQQGATLIAL